MNLKKKTVNNSIYFFMNLKKNHYEMKTVNTCNATCNNEVLLHLQYCFTHKCS